MVTKQNPNYKKLAEYYGKSILSQTAKDMVRKNYLPEVFGRRLLADPMLQGQSLYNYTRETFGEYSCPHCALTIKCPKEWIKQHIKTHFKREKKENEMQLAEVKPYY